jgi:glycosyltransferase involved in cell wall biosynthesis
MEKPGLKILMITPLSSGIVHGGVRMQSRKTAEYLRELGHTVDQFNPWVTYEIERYDCIHLFLAANETLATAQRLSTLDCRLMVSPVFFTRRSSAIIKKAIKAESIGSKFFKGLFSDYSIKAKVCRAADLVLPNTKEEAELIVNGFGIHQEKVKVIPNGVDIRFEKASSELFHKNYGIRDFVLFVGDASAERKNLYPLLNQYKNDDPPLVIIGALNDSPYSDSCRRIISAKITSTTLGRSIMMTRCWNQHMRQQLFLHSHHNLKHPASQHLRRL